jgi:hypothetical protein
MHSLTIVFRIWSILEFVGICLICEANICWIGFLGVWLSGCVMSLCNVHAIDLWGKHLLDWFLWCVIFWMGVSTMHTWSWLVVRIHSEGFVFVDYLVFLVCDLLDACLFAMCTRLVCEGSICWIGFLGVWFAGWVPLQCARDLDWSSGCRWGFCSCWNVLVWSQHSLLWI